MDVIMGVNDVILTSFLDLHGIGENLVGRLVFSGRGHHEQATNITPQTHNHDELTDTHYAVFMSL
jgi:hypothetical protein